MANISAIKLPNNTTYNLVDNTSGYTKNTGTITSVKTTAGTHSVINVTSGAANFNVPTKTSHLTNDSGFLTSHQTLYEANLNWGNTGISGNVTPMGASLSSEHSANRIAYLNPAAIQIEYTTNGGSSWTDSGYSGTEKTWLCTGSQNIAVGQSKSGYSQSTALTTNHWTRITLTGQNGTNTYVYTAPRKLLVNMSTAVGVECLVEYKTGASGASWQTFGTYTVSGWSGWNDIPLVLSTFGGGTTQTTNYWYLRFTFKVTSTRTDSYKGMSFVNGLRLFGSNDWTSASSANGKGPFSSTGHLYSYDVGANATFPAKVTATGGFSGNVTGTATGNLTSVQYDSTNAKLTYTKNGSNTDIVTVATLKSALGSMPASDVYSWAKASTKPTYTASEVGALPSTASIPTKTSDLTNDSGFITTDTNTWRAIQVNGTQILAGTTGTNALNLKAGTNVSVTNSSGTVTIAATDTTYSSKTAASGGTDVSLVTTGEKYTWNNKSNLALGETSSAAYRGDRGKTAYDHSQSTHARTDATAVTSSTTNGKIKINGTETTVYTHPGSGTNPHGTTKSDVGLGNVGNFKAVSTVASQGLSTTEQSNARANIGAGTSSLTIGTSGTTAAAGNHTHTTSLATDTGTSTVTLASATKYKLTAGGNSVIFAMPTISDTNVTQNYSTTDAEYPLLFSSVAGISSTSTRGAVTASVNNELHYNPRHGILQINGFNDYQGNYFSFGEFTINNYGTELGFVGYSSTDHHDAYGLKLGSDYASLFYTNEDGDETSISVGPSYIDMTCNNSGIITIGSDSDVGVEIPHLLTTATDTRIGGARSWKHHTTTSIGPTPVQVSSKTTVNSFSTTSGRYYGIESDLDGRLFVNVPWTDTDTKVTVAENTKTTKYYPILATGTGTATRQIDTNDKLNSETASGLYYQNAILGTPGLNVGDIDYTITNDEYSGLYETINALIG